MPEYYDTSASEELNRHNDSLGAGHVGECRTEPHGWGREDWIVNSDLYCGKLLRVEPGKRCSFHFHIKKHEHFCLLNGNIDMTLVHKDGRRELIKMTPGDILYITPGLVHSFICPESEKVPAILLEVSTRHYEDDSYRVVKGD